jgi:hypothetical protein
MELTQRFQRLAEVQASVAVTLPSVLDKLAVLSGRNIDIFHKLHT